MKIESLLIFVAAAQAGSFAKVAKERSVDPSLISRAIMDLEQDLGFRLFQRTTRRLTLTEAGEMYLGHLDPVLEELDRARDMAANISATPEGKLRLTASVTFGQVCIVPLLPKLRARFPRLKLECLFSDDNLDLVLNRIDLAIRLAPAIEGNVIASKLMETRYRVVASPNYLRKSPGIQRPDDLSAHRVLLHNIPDFRSNWLFRDKRGRVTKVVIDGDIMLSPPGSIRLAALNNLGPALLPSWLVVQDIAARRLIDLFPQYDVTAKSFDRAAWIVYPSRSFLPAKVRVAIDFLKAELGR